MTFHVPFEKPVALFIERVKKGELHQKCDSVLDVSPLKIAVYLPVWPSAVRGIPNGVLRSALFGVVKKGVRISEHRDRSFR